MKKAITTITALGMLTFAVGCTFISKATEYSGLTGQHGKPVEFYSATNVGMMVLFFLPIAGDPTVPATLRALTERVKGDGGTNVRVIQSGTTYFWYVLFPFSLIIHPVATSVTADAEFEGPAAAEKKAGAAAGEKKGAGAKPAGKAGARS